MGRRGSVDRDSDTSVEQCAGSDSVGSNNAGTLPATEFGVGRDFGSGAGGEWRESNFGVQGQTLSSVVINGSNFLSG